jgi:hypothetical protein
MISMHVSNLQLVVEDVHQAEGRCKLCCVRHGGTVSEAERIAHCMQASFCVALHSGWSEHQFIGVGKQSRS